MVSLTLTKFQVLFLVKILKNYKNLRKSHFFTVSSGMKQEKVTDELVLIEGLVVYMESL